jgi:hypothetical protein
VVKAALLLTVALASVQFVNSPRSGAETLLCKQRGSLSIRGEYAIKNDNFAGAPQCLTTTGGDTPGFKVAVSKANSTGVEPLSYPEIFIGCTWGRCSPDSPLPARLNTLRDPRTSWETSQRAGGVWNAAYDLWFDRYPLRNGQATGAEMMIWLNSKGTESSASWPVVTLDGTRWYLVTWITHGHGKRWRYISFRKVDPTWQVRHLELAPFFRVAERSHWIKPDWYLLNIDAGFEIWRGGKGLTTRSFSAVM